MKQSRLRLILILGVAALILALVIPRVLTAQSPAPQAPAPAETYAPLEMADVEAETGQAAGLSDAALLPAEPEAQQTGPAEPEAAQSPAQQPQAELSEDGSYTSKEDVALFIRLYGRLPDNFISKDEARKLGWEGGSLEDYAPGKCIGGDRFGNYEGLLPTAKGRRYTECDIDTLGKNSRGAKRIVFSNDGLIYYSGDHYASFTLLYGEE